MDHVDIATLRAFMETFGVEPSRGNAWWCPLGHHMRFGPVVMVEECKGSGKVWVMPVWGTSNAAKFEARYVPRIEVLDIQPIRVAWRSATGKMELSGGAKVQLSEKHGQKLKTWLKKYEGRLDGPRYDCLNEKAWMSHPRWTRRETELEGSVRMR